jgi:uncharacterized lipoprotein YmbA
MKWMMLISALTLAACGDVPVLTSPAEALADRAAHENFLASQLDPEYLADCEHYNLEECQ